MHVASLYVVNFIVKGAKVNTKDNSWLTALHYCAARGHEVQKCVLIGVLTISVLICTYCIPSCRMHDCQNHCGCHAHTKNLSIICINWRLNCFHPSWICASVVKDGKSCVLLWRCLCCTCFSTQLCIMSWVVYVRKFSIVNQFIVQVHMSQGTLLNSNMIILS